MTTFTFGEEQKQDNKGNIQLLVKIHGSKPCLSSLLSAEKVEEEIIIFCLHSEYDALSRLGITDGRQFLKRRFQKLPVKFLPTCCVGESLQDQVEAAIDEALSSGEWVDILVSVTATNCTAVCMERGQPDSPAPGKRETGKCSTCTVHLYSVARFSLGATMYVEVQYSALYMYLVVIILGGGGYCPIKICFPEGCFLTCVAINNCLVFTMIFGLQYMCIRF